MSDTLAGKVISFIDEVITEAVEAERERWAAILSTAKDEAIRSGDYPIAAALRDCWDAGTFQISPSPNPEPPAPEPMTIERLSKRYDWGERKDLIRDLCALARDLDHAQARRDAEMCSNLAESAGTTLSHCMGCRDCQGTILKAAGLQ